MSSQVIHLLIWFYWFFSFIWLIIELTFYDQRIKYYGIERYKDINIQSKEHFRQSDIIFCIFIVMYTAINETVPTDLGLINFATHQLTNFVQNIRNKVRTTFLLSQYIIWVARNSKKLTAKIILLLWLSFLLLLPEIAWQLMFVMDYQITKKYQLET